MPLRLPLAVAGVLLAGAAAAAAGYFLWPSGTSATTCAGPVHAAVPAAAEKALAAYAGRIKHTVEGTALAPAKETWIDSATGNHRNVTYDTAGKVTSEFAQVPLGARSRYTWILYAQGIWIRGTEPGAALAASDTAVVEAQAFRDKVASGAATLVGRELVDGRRTLHLREQLSAVRLDTWVDALTYVPVQTRTGQPGQLLQTQTTWLPRTPANLAQTKAAVPKGLRRVAPIGLGNGTGNGSGDSFALAAPGPGCAQS